MYDEDKIIYTLNIEDVQTVAQDEMNRKLNDEELKIVEETIGDYINWYDGISLLLLHEIRMKED